jgi:hypothetical protein
MGYQEIEHIDFASMQQLLESVLCVMIDIPYANLDVAIQTAALQFLNTHLQTPSFDIEESLIVYKRI